MEFFIKIRMLNAKVKWMEYYNVESFEFRNNQLRIHKKNSIISIGLNLFDKIIIKKKK